MERLGSTTHKGIAILELIFVDVKSITKITLKRLALFWFGPVRFKPHELHLKHSSW